MTDDELKAIKARAERSVGWIHLAYDVVALVREVEALRRVIVDAESAMDSAERANGDAPHRCVSLASRIQVMASGREFPVLPVLRTYDVFYDTAGHRRVRTINAHDASDAIQQVAFGGTYRGVVVHSVSPNPGGLTGDRPDTATP